MQDVGHQRLETHILHTGYHLRRLEVLVGRIASALAKVIDQVFGHFAEGSTFLAEVDDDADASWRAVSALVDVERDEKGSNLSEHRGYIPRWRR